MAICDIREENENDNHIRMGKPKGKLTRGAKKWTAQFKDEHKADPKTNTKAKQGQKMKMAELKTPG